VPSQNLRINYTIERALEEDRSKLEAFLRERSAYPVSQGAETDAAFKKAHKAVYGLCIWSHEFSESPIHQRVFLAELRSDALQSIYMALNGFKKPAALLLRSVIEDLLRHLYYYDHQIEFEKLEKTPSSFAKSNVLWQYAKEHPRLENLFEKSRSIDLLENYHAVFSKFVHSTTTTHMNLTKSLDEIGFDKGFFIEYAGNISLLAENAHFVLLVFYQKTTGSFSPEWKSFIVNTISPTLRKLI
jgi:hypothetical protein